MEKNGGVLSMLSMEHMLLVQHDLMQRSVELVELQNLLTMLHLNTHGNKDLWNC